MTAWPDLAGMQTWPVFNGKNFLCKISVWDWRVFRSIEPRINLIIQLDDFIYLFIFQHYIFLNVCCKNIIKNNFKHKVAKISLPEVLLNLPLTSSNRVIVALQVGEVFLIASSWYGNQIMSPETQMKYSPIYLKSARLQ